MKTNLNEYHAMAELLKALAHPVRLCIVRGLLEEGPCNVSHMQRCLELPQSTLSQHLQKLRILGIVTGERQGTEIAYRVTHDIAKQIISLIP